MRRRCLGNRRLTAPGWSARSAARCASRRVRDAGEQLDPVVDVVLHLHAGAAEHPEAVEVADERPVRVLELVGATSSSSAPLQQRGVGPDQQRGLAVPGAMTPDVQPRAPSRPAVASTAKYESRRRCPGGGNCRTSRSKRPRVCCRARRIVAVEAIDLRAASPRACRAGRSAVSYRPASVPSGPEMRCSSSWMISSGGRVAWIVEVEQSGDALPPRQARELVGRGDDQCRVAS